MSPPFRCPERRATLSSLQLKALLHPCGRAALHFSWQILDRDCPPHELGIAILGCGIAVRDSGTGIPRRGITIPRPSIAICGLGMAVPGPGIPILPEGIAIPWSRIAIPARTFGRCLAYSLVCASGVGFQKAWDSHGPRKIKHLFEKQLPTRGGSQRFSLADGRCPAFRLSLVASAAARRRGVSQPPPMRQPVYPVG